MTFKLSAQQQAVLHWAVEESGSLELLARAGCGKTSTLLQLVDVIHANRLGDVAIMAYNKSIADEIKGKLDVKGIDWKIAQAGTVHSFGFSAWRKSAPHVRVDSNKVRDLIEAQKYTEDSPPYRHMGSTIAKLVSLAKQQAFGHLTPIENMDAWYKVWDHFDLENDLIGDYTAEQIINCAKRIYKMSLDACMDVVDFDDMILAPLYFKARFWPKKWVMLDEAQDTNPARRALALAMLAPKTGRFVSVGDDFQAIYGFTGADSNSMQQLKTATRAKTLPLTVTFRCPKAVVAEAKKIVPDIIAHESAPEGKVSQIQYDEMLTNKLTARDVILCRNTAPLIQTAYSLLSRGTACKVEGREIGEGLIKLARRWKVGTLDKLLDKLEEYQARQTAKLMSQDKENKIDALEDQVNCLRIVINRCTVKKKYKIDDLVAEIDGMFGNTPEGQSPKVLTLSTIHRSKGREWPRVFFMGVGELLPSPYAKKDWQLQQETNLEYVGITRAQEELVYVPAPPKNPKMEGK